MKINCPQCSNSISPHQVNVATDVAFCERCEEAFSISDLISAGQAAEEYENVDPPQGVWFDDTIGGWILGASTRSPMALFLVPFMCVWSGGSLGGIYGMQIIEGEFNLLLSLFGIPFVLGTLLFGSIAVMSVCGKITVTVDGNTGTVFEGVGPIGWKRQFDWSGVTRIEEDHRVYRSSRSHQMQSTIVLEGKKRLKFGSLLPEARQHFMLHTLRRLLAARPTEPRRR